MVTIKQIAEKAGVSPSTVSRVISNDSRISEATKNKIKKIMSEMNYHPNAIARSLVSKTTKTIGIIMPYSADQAFLNPFFIEAIRGISKYTYNEDYCILITNGFTVQEQIKSLHSLVFGRRVDGIILMYSKANDSVLEELENSKIPFCMIGRPVEYNDITYVDNDNILAAYKATQYLIDMGHNKIGFLNGSLDFTVCVDRYKGFRKALEENNIPIIDDIVVSLEFLQEDGYKGMKKILESPHKPTAVLATDDLLAFGAIRAAGEMGVKVPEDISIIGFNNIPLSELIFPSLTSVDIDSYKIGATAAQLVLQKIKGDTEVKSRIIDTKLIMRNSVCSNC
ncbi:LacI family DNA-binding transcriptional regulator [Clostridium brassicae]|uniref:LacI family DNA-binding transcriptional regulator n=1 Tax=Clostridium brassicae TaxID=2999072 RepID=A0ABT4D8N3_9CLOT|nr:LacI family DNA-binding transcriptional regulator [Clostridium brassicae]MCY6958646.1 LacI family DNA-binding transcriptional regulator [Clostridium brassicae]